jgi:hypothetical protein
MQRFEWRPSEQLAPFYSDIGSANPTVLAGYMGKSGAFDDALASFAKACAAQTKSDHSQLAKKYERRMGEKALTAVVQRAFDLLAVAAQAQTPPWPIRRSERYDNSFITERKALQVAGQQHACGLIRAQ